MTAFQTSSAEGWGPARKFVMLASSFISQYILSVTQKQKAAALKSLRLSLVEVVAARGFTWTPTLSLA